MNKAGNQSAGTLMEANYASAVNAPPVAPFAEEHISNLHSLAEMIDETTKELYQLNEFLFGSEPSEVQQGYGTERTTWTNDAKNATEKLRQSVLELKTVKDKLKRFYQ